MLGNEDTVLEVMGKFSNNWILWAERREVDEITIQVKRERVILTEMPWQHAISVTKAKIITWCPNQTQTLRALCAFRWTPALILQEIEFVFVLWILKRDTVFNKTLGEACSTYYSINITFAFGNP